MKGDDCFGKRVAGSETTRRGIGRIHGGNRQGQESAVAMLKHVPEGQISQATGRVIQCRNLNSKLTTSGAKATGHSVA